MTAASDAARFDAAGSDAAGSDAAGSDAARSDAAGSDVAAFDALATGGEIQRRIGTKTSRDEPLARFTTMRVGGPADLFVVAHNRMELRALVRFANARALPYLLLGRGSDIVISDRGVRGIVIQDRAEGSRIEGDSYIAEAGVPMARAATETQHAGLTGLEFGLAIPGTVGGAVWANAGAHDADVGSILEWADLLLPDGTEQRVVAADLALAYRDSRLKHEAQEIVIAASFRLTPADADTIKARLDDIRRWRREHQPLGIPSAGSVFRNPQGDSAGRLIEAAGLKGRRIGGAVVSEKHANFIVNDQRGSAADVRHLVDEIRTAVERAHGVRLVEEVVFAGEWAGWPWPGADEAGA